MCLSYFCIVILFNIFFNIKPEHLTKSTSQKKMPVSDTGIFFDISRACWKVRKLWDATWWNEDLL